MHHVGSMILEKLLNSDSDDYRGRTLLCERGDLFEFKEYRAKQLLTVLGPVTVERAYYYDHECRYVRVFEKSTWMHVYCRDMRSAKSEAPRASARGIRGKTKRNCAEANPPFHRPQQASGEDGRPAVYAGVSCRHSSPCFRTGHPGEGE